MCRICKVAEASEPQQALQLIAGAMRKAKTVENREHFKKVLDKILGTEEPKQNAEADDAFERAYRNR